MGDSFAEGLGTRYEDTFAGLIDGKLSRDGIEVLNGAASGYSPVIYYAKIRYLIEELKLRLDEVTVFIDIGDADDEARLYRMDKNGNVAKVTSGTPLRREAGSVGIKAIIRQNTVLCYIVLNALHDIVVRDMMGPPLFTERTMWTIEDDPGRTISGKAVGRMQLYMGRLYRLLKDRGIKLRLAVYPQPAQIYFNDIGSVQERIWARWAMRHGVDFIDYFPYFIDIQSEKARAKAIKKYFIKGDIHWNAEGHALVADRWLEYFYEDVRYRAADRGEEKTPENMPPL
jgi:hypothetical protein